MPAACEYGPKHREVAVTLTNLGIAYGSLGVAARRRALRIKDCEYGPVHREVANTRCVPEAVVRRIARGESEQQGFMYLGERVR